MPAPHADSTDSADNPGDHNPGDHEADDPLAPAGGDHHGPTEPWYIASFRGDYLNRYRHRDEREAEQAIATLWPRLGIDIDADATVLDVGCGGGRHIRALLAIAGIRTVIGLDLSADLLAKAAEDLATPIAAGRVQLIRGDMRDLPVADQTVDAVLSFFTTFGYFHDDAENERVIAEAYRVLRSGGRYVLDFLNVAQARATLVATEHQRVPWPDGGERELRISRRFDDATQRFEKHIHQTDPSGDAAPVDYHESVRAYSPLELQTMIADAGFVIDDALGDYSGDALTPTAPRAIILARRS